jgi:ribosomal protein S21
MPHTKAVPVNGMLRATVTMKISRIVRDHITASTILDEPIDRTLRRLLKLNIPAGVFPQRAARKACEAPPDTTTIKVTEEVRECITSQTHWNESIDQTLRRIFKLKTDNGAVPARSSR